VAQNGLVVPVADELFTTGDGRTDRRTHELTHTVYVQPIFSIISIVRCRLQLNPTVNAFQRKFVNEVRRCEEMERKLRECVFSFFAVASIIAIWR